MRLSDVLIDNGRQISQPNPTLVLTKNPEIPSRYLGKPGNRLALRSTTTTITFQHSINQQRTMLLM
jgi:hypothetical protein